MRVRLLLPAVCLLVLSGCQEIRGPVWSLDGKRVAYTTYTPTSSGIFDTSLYVVETDMDAAPELIAKGAAFPHWREDSMTLNYLGDRDQQGFYTKILKQKIGAVAGPEKEGPQPILANVRLVGFQMSADGSVALLCSGSQARLGSAVRLEMLSVADGKKTDLSVLGEVYSPALTPNGKLVAYAQKPAAALPLLIVCDIETRQPTAVFPTETENENNATSYVIHAFPDNDKFLFYAPGGANIWTVRRDGSNIRKYPLPEGVSSPVMVTIADDSNSVSITTAHAAAEKVLYQVHKLEFTSKRWTRIDGDSPELLGGHVMDPRALRRKGPTRYAWLSSAGLAVGEPGKAKYYPMTSNQCLAASALHIQQNEPDLAVATALRAREINPPPDDPGQLDKADSKAYLAQKKMDRAAESFERAALLYPIGVEGLTFVFPPSSGLPRSTPDAINATLKEMDEFIQALPNNNLLPKLKQALTLRSQGNQKQAMDLYRQCVPILPDEARIGGVRFLEAMCAFETGDMVMAGEKWEAAARCADFPQADYAAGLSAMAYLLSERPEASAKASTVLNLPPAKNSPFAQELSGLPNLVRGRTIRENNLSKEAVAADNSVRAWVQIERCQVPFAYLKSTRIEEDGKFSERRIGVRTTTASSVWLAGMQQPIFRIPRPITVPAISPNNNMLAFAVSGEVFPLPESLCDVFVIDLRGTLILGDAKAPYTGRVQSRYTVKNVAWSGALELTVTANQIDVFGGDTAVTRVIPVPQLQVVRQRGAVPAQPAPPKL